MMVDDVERVLRITLRLSLPCSDQAIVACSKQPVAVWRVDQSRSSCLVDVVLAADLSMHRQSVHCMHRSLLQS